MQMLLGKKIKGAQGEYQTSLSDGFALGACLDLGRINWPYTKFEKLFERMNEGRIRIFGLYLGYPFGYDTVPLSRSLKIE